LKKRHEPMSVQLPSLCSAPLPTPSALSPGGGQPHSPVLLLCPQPTAAECPASCPACQPGWWEVRMPSPTAGPGR
jgi:hypothetical protein